MAARKIKPHHQEDVRKKIQATQLINRLNSYIEGAIQLTDGQIKAIKILLDKSVSNADSNVNVSAETTVTYESEPVSATAEWLETTLRSNPDIANALPEGSVLPS